MFSNSILLPLLIGLAAFLAMTGVVAGARTITDPARRRVKEVGIDSGLATPTGDTYLAATRRVIAWLRKAGALVKPAPGREATRIEKLLEQAGFSRRALPTFYSLKYALTIVLLVATLIATQFLPTLTQFHLVLLILGVAFLGIVGPNRALEYLASKRQLALRNAFPDMLDLLIICVEAGLGLTAAIQRVGEELGYSHPALAVELGLLAAETRAGVDRETALKNLADRTGLDDIRGLVSLLVQTMRFGTTVADTLRVYSEEFRDKRMQRAEEQAAKIGTKLVFPLVFCLFPSFFAVAIGPAALRLMEVFEQLGGQLQ